MKYSGTVQEEMTSNIWKEKEIYEYIHYIMLLKLLDETYCIKLFSLFSFCTACTSIGCSFIQVSRSSTFHSSVFLTRALSRYVMVL